VFRDPESREPFFELGKVGIGDGVQYRIFETLEPQIPSRGHLQAADLRQVHEREQAFSGWFGQGNPWLMDQFTFSRLDVFPEKTAAEMAAEVANAW